MITSEIQVMTKVDKPYQPPLKMKRFVGALLNFADNPRGEKTKAQELSGTDRKSFYKLYNESADFKQWFDEQISTFSELVVAKGVSILNKIIDDGESEHAKIQAVRTLLEMTNRIKINSVNIDRSVNVSFLSLIKAAQCDGNGGGE